MREVMSEAITIRYADSSDSRSLKVRLIAQWDRGDIPAMIMSTSSGPKDYIKNDIFSLFERHKDITRVIMVRGGGPFFLLMRGEDNCWFDMSGRQVTTNRAAQRATRA